jgi:hypothetical protein
MQPERGVVQSVTVPRLRMSGVNLHSSICLIGLHGDNVTFNSAVHSLAECKYRVLVGKPVGKGPLGRPRGSWEDVLK